MTLFGPMELAEVRCPQTVSENETRFWEGDSCTDIFPESGLRTWPTLPVRPDLAKACESTLRSDTRCLHQSFLYAANTSIQIFLDFMLP
jgi:hypothetical protein